MTPPAAEPGANATRPGPATPEGGAGFWLAKPMRLAARSLHRAISQPTHPIAQVHARARVVLCRMPVPVNLRALPKQLRAGWRLRHPARPLRLHLGCAGQHEPGFINIDMTRSTATDYVTDISRLPCPDGSAERIETCHVVQHIPHPNMPAVLAEWWRVLAPDGVLVIECADFDEAARQYLAGDDTMLGSIYGRQRNPGDTHYYGFNVPRLRRLLRDAGFGAVEQREPQDYHAQHEPCLRVEATR